MFLMSSDISIGKYKNIKPNSVKWKCSVSSFRDECTILLPLKSYLKETKTVYQEGAAPREVESIITKTSDKLFKEGDPVDVLLGYNGVCTRRFKGFVKQINYATPLEIECEGYSYQLRDKIFTKSYKKTSVKGILTDLLQDTEIKISEFTQDAPLENVTFKNAPALKVLEWFQKECLMTVYFDFDTIYVGFSRFGVKKPRVKLRLGWNVIESKELKKDVADSEIQINLIEKNNKGETKRTKSEQRKYSNIKEERIRSGLDEKTKKEIVDERQRIENHKGYRGDITCFLIPHIDKAYAVDIEDTRFPDRSGGYFVESVDGSYNANGGRQKLTLGYYGKRDGQ